VHQQSYFTLGLVSTGMGYHAFLGKPHQYVTRNASATHTNWKYVSVVQADYGK